MVVSRITQLVNRNVIIGTLQPSFLLPKRYKPFFRSGALKNKPEEVPFGIFSIFGTVVIGLFIGAMISKNIANFLEENDLFVPSDDDDDDD